jgi:hypothetical protein
MEYFDNIGNKLEIGDEVLILVPKSDASYRKGIVKDFRKPYQSGDYFHCEVLIEYDDGRLYCNKKYFYQHKGDNLIFIKKFIKTWRSNTDIIKFKSEYV